MGAGTHQAGTPIPRDNHLVWLRYAASISIVVSHSRYFDTAPEGWSTGAATVSWLFPGVPVLFFISGFLVSLSYRQTAFWPYLIKRVLRVYPPLWASVIVTVILLFGLGLVQPQTLPWGRFSLWLLGQLTFVFVYHPDFFSHVGIGVLNGSLWAIPVIVQFYILLPWLFRLDARLTARFGNLGLAVVLLAAAMANVLGHYLHNHHESAITKVLMMCTIIPMFFIFMLGYVAQRNFGTFWAGNRWAWLGWLVAYLTAFALFHLAGLRWGRNDINPVLVTLLSLTIVNLAYLPPSSRPWYNAARLFLQKNDISFGMFVYHMLVLNLLVHYDILANNWPLRLTAFFVGTILLATVSMFWLERPIRERREAVIQWVLLRIGQAPAEPGSPSPESSMA